MDAEPAVIEQDEVEVIDPEACPGCGRGPGAGYGEECDDGAGCGFYRREMLFYT